MTNITGLQNLVPATDSARVVWSTCGVTDEAIVSVPVSALVSKTLILRASGQGLLWPSTTDLPAFSNLTGEIVFTIPIVNKALYFADMSVRIHFTSAWATQSFAWPDTSNALFDRLPLDAFLQAWTNELNNAFARKIEQNIKFKMLVPSISIACTLPSLVPMMCTSAMKTSNDNPLVPCHPCDKCCKCFVQQRCDAGCDECPCVSCSGVQSTILQSSISALIFLFAACLFWKCYQNTIYLFKK